MQTLYRLLQTLTLVVAAVALSALTACEFIDLNGGTETPASPPPGKTTITLVQPHYGATYTVGDRVPIKASADDPGGILRVDLIVDGVVAQTQPLFFAQRHFEYSAEWQPNSLGQHTLSLVAYNVDGGASDPATIVVNVNPEPQPSATLTPYIIIITATPPKPPPPTQTPRVIVVTATPVPTRTLTPTPRFIVVTATPLPPTQTPIIKIVTATPKP